MNTNHGLQRAVLYVQQGRYAEAEKELRQILSGNPEQVDALFLLAQAVYSQQRYQDALDINERALTLQANDDEILAQRSQILFHLDREKEAVELLEQAIALNPIAASYRGFLGQIKLVMKDYEAALIAANAGLALDPEHSFCLNVRAQALVKLERPADAHSTIATALEQDPENSYTHSNLGWSLLESGKGQHALPHFREALRLDPNNAYAQSGMIEAIKANNFFYRMFLRYVFWMNRMSSQYQWAFIIGIYVAYRVLLGIAKSSPELSPIITPLLYLYIAFALSTWFFEPISNLFLFLHPDGRYLLSDQEKWSARITGLAGLTAVGFLASYWISQAAGEDFLMLALGAVALMIPYSTMFKGKTANDKRMLVGYAIVLTLCWLWSLVHVLIGQPAGAGIGFTGLFLGVFVYQFFANAKMTSRY